MLRYLIGLYLLFSSWVNAFELRSAFSGNEYIAGSWILVQAIIPPQFAHWQTAQLSVTGAGNFTCVAQNDPAGHQIYFSVIAPRMPAEWQLTLFADEKIIAQHSFAELFTPTNSSTLLTANLQIPPAHYAFYASYQTIFIDNLLSWNHAQKNALLTWVALGGCAIITDREIFTHLLPPKKKPDTIAINNNLNAQIGVYERGILAYATDDLFLVADKLHRVYSPIKKRHQDDWRLSKNHYQPLTATPSSPSLPLLNIGAWLLSWLILAITIMMLAPPSWRIRILPALTILAALIFLSVNPRVDYALHYENKLRENIGSYKISEEIFTLLPAVNDQAITLKIGDFPPPILRAENVHELDRAKIIYDVAKSSITINREIVKRDVPLILTRPRITNN